MSGFQPSKTPRVTYKSGWNTRESKSLWFLWKWKALSSLWRSDVKLRHGTTFYSLAGNNGELSGGDHPVAVHPGLRLSDRPGNKSHSWVLNSLHPAPMQGAGDDWWECFPARFWDRRIAGTGVFQGWDTRVNIVFSDTPFPSIVIFVFTKSSRKLLKRHHYISYFLWEKECGSNGWLIFYKPTKPLQKTAEM